MEGVFELKEVEGESPDAAKVKSGLVKVGDFACFSSFLESMAS
jgi:hypothetical protein